MRTNFDTDPAAQPERVVVDPDSDSYVTLLLTQLVDQDGWYQPSDGPQALTLLSRLVEVEA